MNQLELQALHGLAVKNAGTAASVAALLGREPEEVGAALQGQVEAGRVLSARGTFMVTPSGRTWLDEQYPEVFSAYREDADVAEAAERFERVNRDLLSLLTDWQSMPAGGERVPNDHSDQAYDHAIIDRLGDLHERAAKLVDRLARPEPRLAVYGQRLEAAYDKVLAGQPDFVSGVRVDSYHIVWHELHEDLLRMLGRSRQE